MRGKATGGTVAILNADTPTKTLWSYVFYDKFCRIIQTRSDHHLEGEDIIWSDYNYPGWLLKTRREHTAIVAGNNQAVTIQERYDYDHIGRLLRTYHQINNEEEQLICENSYNERDELQQKRLGVDDNMSENNDALQEVDYDYNIRGWLTKINELNDANDLFAMELKYTENIAGNFNNTVNYNGNITAVEWKFQSDANSKIYSYEYDDLNRLTTAVYGEHDGTSFLNKNRYNSAYSYDENGNILTLERKGRIQNNVFATVDDMIYSYFDDGRLEQIEETSQTSRGFKTVASNGIAQYGYDANGNMTGDGHKDIVVAYNHLNLPTGVVKTAEGGIVWSYDATGKKLSKQVTKDSLLIIDTIEDGTYNANWITSTGNVDANSDVTFVAVDSIVLKAGFSAKHDFVAKMGPNTGEVRHYCNGIEYFEGEMEAIYHKIGRVFFSPDTSIYEYSIQNYLGNTVVVFRDDGNGVAVSIQETDYYSFGMEFEDETNNDFPYKFNGIEKVTDLSLDLDFAEFRTCDASIGRWWQVDPLSENYSNHAVFSSGLNNPIRIVDPSGAAVERFDEEERSLAVFSEKNSSSQEREEKAFEELMNALDGGRMDIGTAPPNEYVRSSDGTYTQVSDIGGDEFDIIHEGTVNEDGSISIISGSTQVVEVAHITIASEVGGGGFRSAGVLFTEVNSINPVLETMDGANDPIFTILTLGTAGSLGAADDLGTLGFAQLNRVPKGQGWLNLATGKMQQAGTWVSQKSSYLKFWRKGKGGKDFSQFSTSRGNPSNFEQKEDDLRSLLENLSRKQKDSLPPIDGG